MGQPHQQPARHKVGIARRAARHLAKVSVPIDAAFAPGTKLEVRVGEPAAFVRSRREGVATLTPAPAEPEIAARDADHLR